MSHPYASIVSEDVTRSHRAAWYVYDGADRIRHTAAMRGQWDYDVVCSCGWDSSTGGGTRRYVEDKLWQHRWDAQEDVTA